ncbi:MAG: sigma-70 family RNA polymerase sigma factor [Planctomycetota bacterium]
MSDRPEERTLDLLQRARNDAVAMQALFERFLPRVRRIAAIRLGRSEQQLLDADDVTQEAMTDAFLGLATFEVGSDGKLCNWLATIVENRIRMTLRAGRRHKRGGEKVQRFADHGSTISGSKLPGDTPTPSQHAAGAELDERVRDALRELPDDYREVLVHRVFCGMTYPEIAESMAMRDGDAVRGLFAKALREAQAKLGPGVGITRGWQ